LNNQDQVVTTKKELIIAFKDIGLHTGTDLMVHSSLKSLGYVVNGASEVIDAIIECIGINQGTLLMPTHTGQLTDPSFWKKPVFTPSQARVIKENMLPFDKEKTQVRGRGILSTTLLTYPLVERSNHPLNSVGALGKKAKFYTEEHDFDSPEGINSPIGKLYQANGKVLGIGVGVNRFTSIHLAEYLMDLDYLYKDNPVVLYENKEGENIFNRIKKYPGDSENFNKILPTLREKKIIFEKKFKLGVLTCFSIKPVIDAIVELLQENPDFLIKE
jgi:aminoglycoside 3-N-acetyltransferase